MLSCTQLYRATLPAAAQSVQVDYDRSYDFSQVESYRWADPQHAERNPLMHQRLVNAVDYKLSMAGARKVDSGADVYVTYHSDSHAEYAISTSHYGYHYGPGWHGSGYSDTNVTRYEIGTLVISESA